MNARLRLIGPKKAFVDPEFNSPYTAHKQFLFQSSAAGFRLNNMQIKFESS